MRLTPTPPRIYVRRYVARIFLIRCRCRTLLSDVIWQLFISEYAFTKHPNPAIFTKEILIHLVCRVHRVSHMDRRRNFKNVYEQEKFPEHHLLAERAQRDAQSTSTMWKKKWEKTFFDKWIFGVAQFCAVEKPFFAWIIHDANTREKLLPENYWLLFQIKCAEKIN